MPVREAPSPRAESLPAVLSQSVSAGESLYWNPLLVTDEKGEAIIEFPVPNRAGKWNFLRRWHHVRRPPKRDFLRNPRANE